MSASAKRNSNKKNSAKQANNPPKVIEAPIPKPQPDYHNLLAEKIASICEDHKMTIFGSYVREYLCHRSLDYAESDIDIFSYHHSLHDIRHIFESQGLRVSVDKTHGNRAEYFDEDGRGNSRHNAIFAVIHLTIGLVNDVFFTGSKIEVKVDFVKGEKDLSPPFHRLDFESNAFIWNKHGIHLSRQTGTDIDTLSARDIKDRETIILENAKKKITTYIPLPDVSEETMSDQNIYWRKSRINRISKMLKNGWTINNISSVQQALSPDNTICIVCQERIDGRALKMSCCSVYYHHHCFVSYGHSELENRTFVRCPQRCSNLHL